MRGNLKLDPRRERLVFWMIFRSMPRNRARPVVVTKTQTWIVKYLLHNPTLYSHPRHHLSTTRRENARYIQTNCPRYIYIQPRKKKVRKRRVRTRKPSRDVYIVTKPPKNLSKTRRNDPAHPSNQSDLPPSRPKPRAQHSPRLPLVHRRRPIRAQMPRMKDQPIAREARSTGSNQARAIGAGLIHALQEWLIRPRPRAL